MGFSSYCQICGMPLSHICLIPGGEAGVFQIYRGDNGDDSLRPEGLVSEDHSWLTRVVALPTDEDESLHQNCTVDDGDVVGHTGNIVADVEDGKSDSHVGIHQECWQLAGTPSSLLVGQIQHIVETESYRSIERKYHDQYFDLVSVLQNPQDRWMLKDPSLDKVNKEHIQALIQEGREYSTSQNDKDERQESHRAVMQPPPPKALVDLPEEMNQQTLYAWLDITPSEIDESPLRLKAAWNRKRKRLHPNAPGGGDPQALERVQWAHRVLSRPEWRQQYDACDFEDNAEATEFANRVWYYVVRDTTT